jgi:hypothetical protein
MSAFRIPGLVVVIGLLVGGVVLDRDREPIEPVTTETVAPVPAVAPPDARSSTWFCAAATADEGGLADGLVILSNTTPDPKTAVISVFEGGRQPIAGGEPDDLVREIDGQSSIDLRLADLAPESALVSIAVEVEGGGVIVEKVVSGPTGVARSACQTEGSADWVVPTGSTIPGARLQLVVFNPFPDDAVVDIDFVTEAGVRQPEDLQALHIPSQSSRLIEIADVVAAAETVSSFVRARRGRVITEAIQSFDGSGDPTGLSIVSGAPAPAETWAFPGVTPALGPARLVVVNPGETIIRADVEVWPSGAERFVEPFELTLRGGQNEIVDLTDVGRLADLDSFTLVVRSIDGPRLVAGLEQRPAAAEPDPLADLIDLPEAPTTGFAASAGQALESLELFSIIEVQEDDDRSALHLYNPAPDTFARIEATIASGGSSRVVNFEVGPLRTARIPLAELATGRYSLQLRSSSPLAAAREVTGLSSRSWAPMLPLG